MTDTTQTKAGESIDGSDWPTREQRCVLEAAAVKFGSVSVERVNGTDHMRLATPDQTAIVNPDGERIEMTSTGPLDYDAITRLRLQFRALEQRYRDTGRKIDASSAVEYGHVAYALNAAEAALFEALNALGHHGDDLRALDAIDEFHHRMASDA